MYENCSLPEDPSLEVHLELALWSCLLKTTAKITSAQKELTAGAQQ